MEEDPFRSAWTFVAMVSATAMVLIYFAWMALTNKD